MISEVNYLAKDVRVSLIDSFSEDKNPEDIRVYQQYVSNKMLELVLIKRNERGGWHKSLQVLIEIFDPDTKELTYSKVVDVDPSKSDVKTQFVQDRNFNLQKSIHTLDHDDEKYVLSAPLQLDATDIDKFNHIFDAEIKSLPQSIFAVGVDSNKKGHIAGNFSSGWFEIVRSINFLIQVLMTHYQHLLPYHFLVCHQDGYIEQNYMPEKLLRPLEVKKSDFSGAESVIKLDDTFPVFHKKKWILTQCAKRNIPFVEPIPDRHFFFCSFYKYFQGIGRGIPFAQKTPKVVYGGKYEEGTRYIHNFVHRKDINMNQRQYLFAHASKKNLVGAPGLRIEREAQVTYKYILDVDGVSATWDAKAWKLASGSVLFLTESSWKHWYQDLLVPWVHYVPIKDDFSDLDEKFEICEKDQIMCMKMAYDGKMLFDKVFNLRYMVEHMKGVINKIN